MFWLVFSIVAWGIVHSILASLGFKDFLRRAWGDGFMKFYRLLYNLFAVISLLPVLYLMITLPDKPLYEVPSPWSYLMRAGQATSALFLLLSVLQTDVLSFAGFRQWVAGKEECNLVTSGYYRFVRHPLYTFSLLILWLSPAMTVNTFVAYVTFTIYIFLGAAFEERKLLREFGREYAEYKAVTPMLIPRLSRNSAEKQGGNK